MKRRSGVRIDAEAVGHRVAGRRRHDTGLLWLCNRLTEHGIDVWREYQVRHPRCSADAVLMLAGRPVAVIEYRHRLAQPSQVKYAMNAARAYADRVAVDAGVPTLRPFVVAGVIEVPAVDVAADRGVLRLRDAHESLRRWCVALHDPEVAA